MRKNWPYLLMLAAVLFILFQVSIRSQPAKVNWSENFTYNSEIPFGCYVFRDYSESLFGQVEESEQTAYDRLADSIITGYNYIFINSYFAPSEPDVHQLLDFVHRGNTVFISARSFGLLGDSLNIETGDPLISALGSDTVLVGGFVQDASDSIQANLLNPSLRLPENTVYSKTTYAVVFTEVDSVNTTLLGTDSRDFPNFIRVKAGAGEFYLHTLPDAFANFYAAAPKNAPYLFRVLSYLEIRPTILDAHYKTGRLINDDSRVYLFAEPTLKYGYYVAITAGLLALLFALKRRQRAVPVVMPEMNTTLQFVEQVGVLYYRQGNHEGIAQKKISYFLESVRARFYVQTNTCDAVFQEKIAALSGVSRDKVILLFSKINYLRTHPNSAREEDLVRMEELIRQFNQLSKR